MYPSREFWQTANRNPRENFGQQGNAAWRGYGGSIQGHLGGRGAYIPLAKIVKSGDEEDSSVTDCEHCLPYVPSADQAHYEIGIGTALEYLARFNYEVNFLRGLLPKVLPEHCSDAACQTDHRGVLDDIYAHWFEHTAQMLEGLHGLARELRVSDAEAFVDALTDDGNVERCARLEHLRAIADHFYALLEDEFGEPPFKNNVVPMSDDVWQSYTDDVSGIWQQAVAQVHGEAA
jgi:hypothetical protein